MVHSTDAQGVTTKSKSTTFSILMVLAAVVTSAMVAFGLLCLATYTNRQSMSASAEHREPIDRTTLRADRLKREEPAKLPIEAYDMVVMETEIVCDEMVASATYSTYCGRMGGGKAGSASSASSAGGVAVTPSGSSPVEGTATEANPQQAGQLTAGSFDDSLDPTHFRAIMEKVRQEDTNELWPALPLGKLIRINVRNDEGKPLADTTLQISSITTGKSVTLRTRNNGQAYFFADYDSSSSDGFSITATPDGQGEYELPSETFDTDQETWEVTLHGAEHRQAPTLDLCFVIDTTGSMSDELAYLKLETASVVKQIMTDFPELKVRLALIVYRDKGDDYVTKSFEFDTLTTFCSNLDKQESSGGGDYPEAMHTALEKVNALKWSKGHAVKLTFLLADAPPHDGDAKAALKAVQDMRRKGIVAYPIAASGVANKCESLMRAAALLTQGQYCFLTDDSGIGNKHAEPHIPYYSVLRLDHLMHHLIASELSGKPLPIDPELVIRRVGKKEEGSRTLNDE